MTDEQRWQAKDWSGAEPPPGSRFPKEASIRITIDVEEDDPNLHAWLGWAAEHLPPQLLRILHPPGSHSLHQARSWYLYFGTILPDAFVSIDETSKLRPTPAPAHPAGMTSAGSAPGSSPPTLTL